MGKTCNNTCNSVIGLVGGIACGKSTVAKYLRDKGCVWIEADSLAHDAFCTHGVLKKLHKKWKVSYPNIIKKEWLDENSHRPYPDLLTVCFTKLEKSKLLSDVAKIVFSDKKELRFLETLLHPIVSMQVTNIVKSREGVIVLDAPLLLETGLDKLCDFIWFINLSFSKRLENFSKRYPNESPSVIQDNLIIREKHQIKLDEKVSMSDIILNNNNNNNMFGVLEKWIKEGSWGLNLEF